MKCHVLSCDVRVFHAGGSYPMALPGMPPFNRLPVFGMGPQFAQYAPAGGGLASGCRFLLPHSITVRRRPCPIQALIQIICEQIAILGLGPLPAVSEALPTGRSHPRRKRPSCKRRTGGVASPGCGLASGIRGDGRAARRYDPSRPGRREASALRRKRAGACGTGFRGDRPDRKERRRRNAARPAPPRRQHPGGQESLCPPGGPP